MIIVKTKVEEHYRNEAGDMATITNTPDWSELSVIKADGSLFNKRYQKRHGASVAMGKMFPGMEFICMTDHLNIKEDHP